MIVAVNVQLYNAAEILALVEFTLFSVLLPVCWGVHKLNKMAITQSTKQYQMSYTVSVRDCELYLEIYPVVYG